MKDTRVDGGRGRGRGPTRGSGSTRGVDGHFRPVLVFLSREPSREPRRRHRRDCLPRREGSAETRFVQAARGPDRRFSLSTFLLRWTESPDGADYSFVGSLLSDSDSKDPSPPSSLLRPLLRPLSVSSVLSLLWFLPLSVSCPRAAPSRQARDPGVLAADEVHRDAAACRHLSRSSRGVAGPLGDKFPRRLPLSHRGSADRGTRALNT